MICHDKLGKYIFEESNIKMSALKGNPMTTLWKIDNDINEALNKVDSETGEWLGASEFEKLKGDREEKLQNLALVIKNKESDAAAIKSLFEEFKERLDKINKDLERLNSLANLHVGANEEIKDPRFGSMYKSYSERVEITDIKSIPQQYLHVVVKPVEINPDKNLIKKAIKEGKEVPGAAIERFSKINIK